MEYRYFEVRSPDLDQLLSEWCGTAGWRVHTIKFYDTNFADVLLERQG